MPQHSEKTATIAFVCDAVYPYNKGGKETRLHEITTRLASQGYDVHIYCMQWWKGKPDIIEDGVHLHGISPFIPLYAGPRRSIKQGVLFGLYSFKLLFKQFDVIDVDHMPFFPLFSVRIVCWLKGKKMFASWHEVWGRTYWREYLGGFKGSIAGLIEQISVSLPDKITAISPLTQHKLTEVLGVSKEKVSMVPCGYSPEEVDKSKKSTQSSDVIYVGRLLAHKNVDVLIETVNELKKTNPNILCRIVGTGPEETRLKQLVRDLNLKNNVVFHGQVAENTEVFSLMKASKVFVLPSTREGFGIVVIEANACGLPVIAIDHPDNAAKDIAQVKAKFTPEDIAKHVEEVLKNKKEIDVETQLEKYSWEAIAKQITKVYGL